MAGKSFSLHHVSSAIIVPILILVILVFGYFVLWSKIAAVSGQKELLVQMQAEVSDRQSSVAGISNLVEEVKDKQGVLAPLDEALPLSPNIPELLSNLEFLVGQSGLALIEIQIDLGPPPAPDATAPSGTGDLTEMFAELSVAGQYEQMQAFLLNVEQNLRILDVQSVDFGSVDSESGRQDYTVKIKTYYHKIRGAL